ncbi:MAG: YdcF family protein, partial [Leptodesmis sp.]|uniref:YdcF family protein n=1 Tax=Leptodesmis sp. TaxID=3100501 RepID=UPI003D0EA486
MVLLLTDIFLLLTQVFLWLIVGLVIWFFLQRVLSKQFLGILVLLLFLFVILTAFYQGGINQPGSVLEILWRVISYPLTPFGLGFILLLLLLTGFVKLGKWAKYIIQGILILLLLGSIPFIAYFLAQELEMEAIELINPLPPIDTAARQVIVLLGRNTTRFQLKPRREAAPVANSDTTNASRVAITETQYQVLSQLPVQMTAHGNRIVYAAKLYQESTGRNPLIIISAGRRYDRKKHEGETWEEISEAQDIQTMLTQTFGVPANAMIQDREEYNIRSSAVNVQKLLRDQGINYGRQLILVASALNMNRAALTFEEVFNQDCIVVRPTDFLTVPSPDRLRGILQGRDLVERELQVTDILPSAEAFYISSQAYQEYLNSFYYFLRRWIRPFRSRGEIQTCPTTPNQTPTPLPAP